MGVFTFVCRSSGDEWSAKQLSGDLEASAGSTYELQRKLVQASLSSDSSGGVQSSFSLSIHIHPNRRCIWHMDGQRSSLSNLVPVLLPSGSSISDSLPLQESLLLKHLPHMGMSL
ncbi:60S acidic ribosomal protein P3-2-like [Camellia sinensis]|uniref:60S acidic ribosomal protein P3-2-like n=1 Tax=Camellia sinensis TaxID=4442 RepID=UPI001036A13C|nr:60S acidic ribosomal protein P3-2-like [Camellia sinensis]